MKLKKFLSGLIFASLCGVGGYAGVKILATEDITTTITSETTVETTTTTTAVQEPPKEKIYWEYYTITEEAVKNSWTCPIIDTCYSFKVLPIYVYLYDPARLGHHRFNISTGRDVKQIDFHVIFVDEYNEYLGEETYTLTSNSLRDFILIIEDFPPNTKYVKFVDILNIVYPDSKKD